MIRIPEPNLHCWRHIGIGPRSFMMGPRRVLNLADDVTARVADQYALAPWSQDGRRRPAPGREVACDAENREPARHFTWKTDAQRWLDEVSAFIVTGH
jgi:hypothetical protein